MKILLSNCMKKMYDYGSERGRYSLKWLFLFLVFLAGAFSALICCHLL
ncbi:MAG: hypothetical protein P4L51_14860 [Puia sp.]|nr:hypothetical protein [Puia sp.]